MASPYVVVFNAELTSGGSRLVECVVGFLFYEVNYYVLEEKK